MRCHVLSRSAVFFAVALVSPAVMLAAESKSGEPKGVAGIIRAQAEVGQAQAACVRAAAEYTASAAQANKTLEEAQGIAIENNQSAVDGYYANRERREAYMQRHARTRVSRDALVRFAAEDAPPRLSRYGLCGEGRSLPWPALLRGEEFGQLRSELDRLFAERTAGDCGPGSQFFHDVHILTEQMATMLRQRVREVAPAEYMAAKKFIAALAYEAQAPQEGNLVAANG